MFLNISKKKNRGDSISKTELNEDDILERDLFEFVDTLENFESGHRKKKEYMGKKPKIIDLYTLERNQLIYIAYRRNKVKKLPKDPQQYFNLLHQYDKEKLIKEITGVKKPRKQKYCKSFLW